MDVKRDVRLAHGGATVLMFANLTVHGDVLDAGAVFVYHAWLADVAGALHSSSTVELDPATARLRASELRCAQLDVFYDAQVEVTGNLHVVGPVQLAPFGRLQVGGNAHIDGALEVWSGASVLRAACTLGGRCACTATRGSSRAR